MEGREEIDGRDYSTTQYGEHSTKQSSAEILHESAATKDGCTEASPLTQAELRSRQFTTQERPLHASGEQTTHQQKDLTQLDDMLLHAEHGCETEKPGANSAEQSFEEQRHWDGYLDLDAGVFSNHSLLPTVSRVSLRPVKSFFYTLRNPTEKYKRKVKEFATQNRQQQSCEESPPQKEKHFKLGRYARYGRYSRHYKPKRRLLERDNPFHQATGTMQVSHYAKGETRSQVLALYSDDWFHVVLSLHTWKIIFYLSLLITISLLAFALLYIAVDRSEDACHITASEEKLSFQAAFGFSLITASTVGYGFVASGDVFYFDCPLFVIVVYIQIIFSLMLNAFVVGLILQRVGRANTRAHQVVFSDKAVIRNINNKFYFSIQVFDLDRRHPVVEAHIRMYAVLHPETSVKLKSFHKHEKKAKSSREHGSQVPETTSGDPNERKRNPQGTDLKRDQRKERHHGMKDEEKEEEVPLYQTKVMRIQSPNDELGGVLFLSIPCIVMHQIDSYSPLFPQSLFPSPGIPVHAPQEECGDVSGNSAHGSQKPMPNTVMDCMYDIKRDGRGGALHPFPGLILRDEDAQTGSRCLTFCPICGDEFATKKHLFRHIRYNRYLEALDEKAASHSEEKENALRQLLGASATDKEAQIRQRKSVQSLSPSVPKTQNRVLRHLDVDLMSLEQEICRPRKARPFQPSKVDSYNPNVSNSVNARFSAPETLNTESTLQDLFTPLVAEETNRSAMTDPPSDAQPSSVHSGPESDLNKVSNGKASDPTAFYHGAGSPPSQLHRVGNYTSGRQKAKNQQKLDFIESQREAIRDHLTRNRIEIVVLVEGIEARSSNTFQARHSYTIDDIEFDKFFAPCMEVAPNGHAQINLNYFHKCVPVPSYVDVSGPVQSHT